VGGQDAENPSSTADEPAPAGGTDASTAARAATLARAKRAFGGWLRGVRPHRKDLRSDVLAAQRAGLRGVLVRTGKGLSFADDPRAAQAAAILDSIAEVPRWLASSGAA